jgi:hypothetical protein
LDIGIGSRSAVQKGNNMTKVDELIVSTEAYEFAHGTPKGRARWGFRLCTRSMTQKDHVHWSPVDTTYVKALKEAKELAAKRGAYLVQLLPY